MTLRAIIAIWLTKEINNKVAQILKTVWSIAMWVVIFSEGLSWTIKSISWRKGLKISRARTVPVTLNATWTRAVRRAFTLAPKLDITASTVEPILLPRTIAALSSQLKLPLAAIVRTIAVMAELEWIRAVIMAPISTPKKIPPIPQLFIAVKSLAAAGPSSRLSLRSPSPINKRANPIKHSAKLWIRNFLKYLMM